MPRLEPLRDEVFARYPDIREMAERYKFEFMGADERSFIDENNALALTFAMRRKGEENIDKSLCFVYVGEPFEMDYISGPCMVGDDASVKSVIIHEVCEADESTRLPKSDTYIAHRKALRRELDYDTGLSANQFWKTFTDYLAFGGDEYGVVNKGITVVTPQDITWKKVKDMGEKAIGLVGKLRMPEDNLRALYQNI